MSKRVQYAHSYPNVTSAPATEGDRSVVFTKEDGVYVRLEDGTLLGPFVDGVRVTSGSMRPQNPRVGDVHFYMTDGEIFWGPTWAELDDSTVMPIIAGHRGDYALRAESALGSYQASMNEYSLVNLALEADLGVTSDNQLVVMHDDTVDRTTNGTGLVSSLTAAQIAALLVDDSHAPFGATSPGPLTVPTGTQILTMAQQRLVLVEPKNVTAGALIVAKATELGVLDRIVANAFSVTDLQPFINAGLSTILHSPDASGLTPQQIKDAGVTHINWRTDQLPASVAPYQAVGLKIWNGGSSRYSWSFMAGVRVGGISDDALWITGTTPVLGADDFASKKFHPGHIAYTAGSIGAFINRGDGVTCWAPGSVAGTGGAGTQGNGWTLQGSMSPNAKSRTAPWNYATGFGALPATGTYPWGYEFDVTYLEAGATPTRRWGVAFTPDDRPFHDTTTGSTVGYGAFLHGDPGGTLYTGLKGQGSARTSAASSALGGAFTVGQTKRIRFRRTSATQLGITVNGGTETLATVSGSFPEWYQGGYLWFGNPGVAGSTGRWGFSNVVAV